MNIFRYYCRLGHSHAQVRQLLASSCHMCSDVQHASSMGMTQFWRMCKELNLASRSTCVLSMMDDNNSNDHNNSHRVDIA